MDKEFQKVLNSLSENKEEPQKIPLIKMPNQIPLLTTPQNIPSKKQKQKQNKREKKKNLDNDIKSFTNHIDTLTDYDIEIIQQMGKEEITHYPKMFLEKT